MRELFATRKIPSPKISSNTTIKSTRRGNYQPDWLSQRQNLPQQYQRLDTSGKKNLDKANINDSSVSIVQASDLKQRLEELQTKIDRVTIAPVDDVSMYSTIKIATIRKAVRFFSIKINAATKKTINLFMDFFRFGMISTCIFFSGEYYKYHSGEK